jgi:hypothetical protein
MPGVNACKRQRLKTAEATITDLEKGRRPQNSPRHPLAFGALDQVLFDVVFANEVRHVRWICKGPVAMSIDRGVNKMLDSILQGCINEIFALLFFGVHGLATAGRVLVESDIIMACGATG